MRPQQGVNNNQTPAACQLKSTQWQLPLSSETSCGVLLSKLGTWRLHIANHHLSYRDSVFAKNLTLRFLLLSSTVRAPVTAADHLPGLLGVLPPCGTEWSPLSPVFSSFFGPFVAVRCSFFCSLITASFSAACIKQWTQSLMQHKGIPNLVMADKHKQMKGNT